MRTLLFLLSFFLIFKGTLANDGSGRVLVGGLAPGYAGEEIIFYSWTDQISFTEVELFRVKVDENNRFSEEVELDKGPLYIFTHAGANFLYMLIEPDSDYELVLPGKTEKSSWEKLNPYFDGIPTHIAVINHDSTGLNAIVSGFDNLYEPLFGEPLIELTRTRDTIFLDSLQAEFDSRFGGFDHPYFNDYRRYKMALFRIMARFESVRHLSNNYFLSEPVLYDNIAYMELFNQVYNKYFQFFSRTATGKRIFDDINKNRSLHLLKETLSTDPVLGEKRLLEMVILKGLHDAFYGSDFSRSSLLVVLDSLQATTAYEEHALIAGHIREKVTKLLAGFTPPDFELKNSRGETVTLSDYLGYYVYLNFCTAANYSCLSEYDILSRINDNHGAYLKVVTIFIDESYQAMLEFLSKNDYDWDFLYYGDQPAILKDYNIRMFPGYYLVDRDGTLLMSPAPSPADNFETYLLRTMRSRGELR
jgi:peroxiredoxin